jgi:hypothetical protein
VREKLKALKVCFINARADIDELGDTTEVVPFQNGGGSCVAS